MAAFAIGNPLRIDLLDRVAGPDATAELESLQLIRTVDDALRPVHPLVAHIAHRRLPTRSRRRVAQILSESVLDDPDVDGAELVRAVTWQIDAHTPIDLDVAIRAAQRALADGDYASARNIAREALAVATEDRRWEPAFVLAQSLRQLGDITDAEAAFTIAATAPDVGDRVDVAVARAHNLAIAGGRFADSLDMLAEIAGSITEPVFRRRLAIERTFLGAIVGDFRAVLAAAEEMLDDDDLDDVTMLAATNGLAFAKAMTLRLDGFDEAIQLARPIAEQFESTYPLAVDQFDLITVVARVAQGRIDDAIGACTARRTRGLDHSWGTGDGAWAAMEAFARSFQCGHEAADAARRAVVGLQSGDPLGLRNVGTGISAIALLQVGQTDEAIDAFEHVSPANSEGDRRSSELIQARIDAWRLAGNGDVEGAAATVAAAGRLALEWGHVLWGMLALHDAVRMGIGDPARAELDHIRTSEAATGDLLQVICHHADAVDQRDPTALLDVVERFLQARASLFAVEAACQAAAILNEQDFGRDAACIIARAQVISGGALPPTPACSNTTSTLTDRQVEIVLLMLAGTTAREAAEALSVSTRTVENHVATVYRNLGVTSRQELADVLNPVSRLSSDARQVE
jgi:DNA-binding NarL/FixJ family response regulator/tetratricopeptide (TPR) repeat protein